MPKILRQPLNNAELQSDLVGKQFNVRDVEAVENRQTRNVYVDSLMSSEIGVISTGVPFKTIQPALDAINNALHTDHTHDVYQLILRPGVYAHDGVLEIDTDNLIITGYGAIITSATAGANETGKILITGRSVSIAGIELDGQVDTATLPPGFAPTQGAVEITAPGVTIRNCHIHDWAGSGINLLTQFSDINIIDNNIELNYAGITGVTGGTADNNTILISGNSIDNNRGAGIDVAGSGDGNHELVNIRVTNNSLTGNNSDDIDKPAIALTAFVRAATISSNYIQGGNNGITLGQCLQAVISNNEIWQIAVAAVELDGCQQVNVTGNVVNGINSQDDPTTLFGVYAHGNYHNANDAGPFIIADNGFYAMTATDSIAIFCDTQNQVTLSNNRLTGETQFKNYSGLSIIGNAFDLTGDAIAITLEADSRTSANGRIMGNSFNVGTPDEIIRIIGAGFSINNLAIIGNSSNASKTYASGVISREGTASSNVFIRANVPISNTVSGGVFQETQGWVNDEMAAFTAVKISIPSSANGGDGYYAGSAKVVGFRDTGWSGDTGTGKKTTNATYDAATISNPPTQAQVQAIANALQNTSRAVKSLKDALVTHGMIGP